LCLLFLKIQTVGKFGIRWLISLLKPLDSELFAITDSCADKDSEIGSFSLYFTHFIVLGEVFCSYLLKLVVHVVLKYLCCPTFHIFFSLSFKGLVETLLLTIGFLLALFLRLISLGWSSYGSRHRCIYSDNFSSKFNFKHWSGILRDSAICGNFNPVDNWTVDNEEVIAMVNVVLITKLFQVNLLIAQVTLKHIFATVHFSFSPGVGPSKGQIVSLVSRRKCSTERESS
jgi:hypothetical protein